MEGYDWGKSSTAVRNIQSLSTSSLWYKPSYAQELRSQLGWRERKMDLPGSTISPRWTKHSASDYKSTPQYLLQPDKPSLNRLKQSSCSGLPLWSQALTLATSGRPGILQLSGLFKCWKKVFLLCSLEVFVGRSGWDTGQKEVLLPKLELMNRFELTIFFVVDDCQLNQHF